MPRDFKFSLGDRMLGAAYDVIERLVEATYSRNRAPMLTAANLSLQKLRIFFRLALDLKHIDPRRFEHAMRSVDEIGRMIGGWMKAGGNGAARPEAS